MKPEVQQKKIYQKKEQIKTSHCLTAGSICTESDGSKV